MLLLLGLGTIALFIGFAMLAPRLVKPLAAVVGWPAQRFGGMAGRARPRELDPQPRPDRLDRGGAHDRARARDRRGRARRRAPRLDAGGGSRPGRGRVRRHVAERLRPVPGGGGRRRRGCSGRRARVERPLRPGARRRDARPRSRASTRETIATFYDVRVDAGLGRDARPSSARTARSSPSRSPRIASSRSATASRSRPRAGETVELVVRGIYDPSELAALLGAVTIEPGRHSTRTSRDRATSSRS